MRSLGVAAAAAALLVAGCGGEESSDEPFAKATASEQDKVELAIADFYGPDRKAVCESLSSGALEQLGGEQKCLDFAGASRATDYNVQSVRFEQDEAVAVVRVAGKVVQFTLVDEQGDWKVSKPLPAGA